MSTFENEDVVPETPQKVVKKFARKCRLKNLLKFAIEPRAVRLPRTVANNRYKPPFVFHEIIDIVNFRLPLDPNIKTLGIYREDSLLDHRSDVFKVNALYVKLKFLASPPRPNDIVEVYGYLSPEREFIVKFWTRVFGDVQRYYLNLKLQTTSRLYKQVEDLSNAFCDK